MSLIPLREPNCEEAQWSIGVKLNKLIRIDSLGQWFINGLYALVGNMYFSFTDAQQGDYDILSDGNIRRAYILTHNLNTYLPGIIVQNNLGAQVNCMYYAIDANSGYVITDQNITGTWNGRAFT